MNVRVLERWVAGNLVSVYRVSQGAYLGRELFLEDESLLRALHEDGHLADIEGRLCAFLRVSMVLSPQLQSIQ